MAVESVVCKRIELSGEDVGLDLPIPGFGVEFTKPLPKSGKLFAGERADFVFDLLDPTHAKSIATIRTAEAGS